MLILIHEFIWELNFEKSANFEPSIVGQQKQLKISFVCISLDRAN